MNPFLSYVRSIFIHRLRTFLSTLGILFGVASVIAMLSIGEGAKQETLDQIEQLGMNRILIRNSSSSDPFSKEDLEAFRRNIKMLTYAVPLKSSLSAEIVGTTADFGEMKKLQTLEGRFICDIDEKEKRKICVLGYDIAKTLGKKGHIGHDIQIHHESYEIVGILKSTYWKSSPNQALASRNLDQTIFVPLSSSFVDEPSFKNISEIILQVENSSQIGTAHQIVKQILKQKHPKENYQIIIPKELFNQANQTQKTFNWVLGSIAAISLLVGGIGIMNIMLATVSERTKEIGIRRAVGASQNHILQQFLFEALVLTFTGAILGVLFGILLSLVITLFADWRIMITYWSVLLALFMSIVVGLCSGIYPAYRAAFMDPVKALNSL